MDMESFRFLVHLFAGWVIGMAAWSLAYRLWERRK